jgi:toxin YoeB
VKLVFADQAWRDFLYRPSPDRALLSRVNELIKECTRTPFSGRGKPEPLRGSLSGWWSRGITQEHRLVYGVEGDSLFIAQCQYHH